MGAVRLGVEIGGAVPVLVLEAAVALLLELDGATHRGGGRWKGGGRVRARRADALGS